MSRIDYITKVNEFMMNIDTYTAHNWLKMNLPDASTNYLRLQTNPSVNAMDSVDKNSTNYLIQDGYELYEENKEAIETFV